MTTPSLITADDYYKANGLNINLQLHASSEVSNPYSFNITKNIGFNSKTLESESGIYTLTVGNIKLNQTAYGYIGSLNLGDLSPKIYKQGVETFTINGFYLIIDYNTLFLLTDVNGKYVSDPICTIIDKNYPYIQDIVFKYNKDSYRAQVDDNVAQYFQASSTIKFRLK